MRDPYDPFAELRRLIEAMDPVRKLSEALDTRRMFREIEAQMELYKPIVDPIVEQLRQTQLAPAFQPHFPDLELARQAAERLVEGLPDFGRLLKLPELSKIAGDWTRQIDLTATAVPDVGAQLRAALDEGLFAPLSSLIDQVRFLAPTAKLGATFAGSAAAQAKAILSAETEAAFEEALLAAQAELEASISGKGKKLVSFEALLAMILTILLFAVDQAKQIGTEERLAELISGVEERLIRAIGSPSQEEGAAAFVVESPLDVRTSPSHSAALIGRIYPGRQVRVLEQRDGWERVEYFDFVAGELGTGWVKRQ